ncbi:helix-turn-helix domain-containing protein [Paenibacillus sp. HWE-109]|uniref:helix-turn-helix domain-containing protein n=1 Tax=Paenibacillus sp. HWE-109 TaxID=1306526 RepID=UPI001EDCD9B4|nr:helix-turn-helix transcriptional regulator [Paenibacillus sp. HWE-109]UKS27168.1 helix-turn-helix domain-containing protein [Paenibacillus sp. HWE-109]
MSTLGSRLRAARERKGWSQTFVCQKLGLSNSTLSGYERDYREPDAETIKIFAGMYEVSTDELLGNSDLSSTLNKMKKADVIKEQSATHLRAYHGGGDDWTEEEKAAADAYVEMLRKRKAERRKKE